ncbi:carcinoembryonic antigen-related cell adhesion molecule 21-like isoform X2 [Mauremys reevesii]|uniref:carcinoembryonic antigen-related cell adhesion molecule 21-like isoform X2 n=1 Tax=Mauremys reevesii TaxID=260615 RepID=UPI00193FB1CF|nr:carcinoembryonic antigen-related cell adhesion molecule 21-like isoform X2 [Mauremys reevesii]
MGRRPGSWDPPTWGGPWKRLLLAASVLGSCLQPAPAQTPVSIVLTPPSPALGGGVSLAPQPTPQNFVSCSWYRSAITDDKNLILSYYPLTPPVQQNGSAHTRRETAGPGCVLHIAGLTLSDNGSYTVKIEIPTATIPVPSITVVLPVYEKLAKPTVTASKTQVPENGTLTLTCNTSPSADTVLWLQNGSYIAPNKRLGLSPDNRTLTVQNFTWGDAGTYQCEVRNPVSTERSEPNTVTLAYGPESARIDPPGPVNLTLGSHFTLTCVADSVPAPSYSWFLNGNKLPQTGSSLTFDLTTLNLGMYKCQADNPVTGLTANAEIEVLEKLAKPMVTPNQNQVPENGTLTLTCNTSPSADTVLWLQNGSSIAPNKQLGLSPDNRTLTVQNFTWGDTGTYQCEVRNPVSTERSEPSTVTLASSPADSGGGLSPGAIAGIVIGSLAAAALLGGLGYVLLRKTGGRGRRWQQTHLG